MRALAGRPVCVDIKHEEWNDRVRARVAYSYETEYPEVKAGSEFAPVDDDDLPF